MAAARSHHSRRHRDHPPGLDEVAGSLADELTISRRSGTSALEAQNKGASHGPLCDRFRWKEIPALHSQSGGSDPAGVALRHRRFAGTAPRAAESFESDRRDDGGGVHIADPALAAGHQVCVVPATLVRSLGVGSRGVKTDRRDAQILSEVSCRIDFPSVHITSARSREWKTICSVQDVLTSSRTKLINNVRGWMRAQGFRTPQWLHGIVLQTTAGNRTSAQLHRSAARAIDAVSQQIAASEKRLESLANNDEICARLMTVPGVGPSTAVCFAAAIDQRSAFPMRTNWSLIWA
jgi:hypothetical protein